MTSMGRKLRDALAEPGVLVVPDCYSLLTARVVEAEGFAATYIGGSAMGGMFYGIPDHGLITMTEMIEMAGVIATGIGIPLIVDADQAGETTVNVRRTVKEFEAAGVAAIHIEDTNNPKHIYDGGDSLVAIPIMQARIEAAIEARRDDDFVIIARSDEMFIGGTVKNTVARGNAFADAGADLYMVVGMKPDEMRVVASEVRIPVVDIMHPVDDVRDTGLKVDLMLGGDRLAVATHREYVRYIAANGRVLEAREPVTPDEYRGLVDDPEWLREAQRWVDTGSRPSKA